MKKNKKNKTSPSTVVLILSLLFIILIFIKTLIYLNHSKTFTPSNQPTYSQSKSTPLFELSSQTENQKKIWDYLKSKYPIMKDNGSEDMPSFEMLLIRYLDNKITANLSGYVILTADIESGSERFKATKEIEQQIYNLGFKKVNKKNPIINKATLVRVNHDVDEYYYLSNQIFRVYSQKGDCGQIEWGGCYVRVEYFNNIDNQLESQTKLLTQIINNKSNDKKYKDLLISQDGPEYNWYIDFPSESKKNGDEIKIGIGKYNSDVIEIEITAKPDIDNTYKITSVSNP